MKEGEIEDKDGNKFKVFWPKPHPPHEKCQSITEKGVEGCCPIGPKGMAGVTGKKNPEPIKAPSLKDMLSKYLYGATLPAAIPIDDSLEKDIIESPVKGRIYKIRQINTVARYMGTHLVSFDAPTNEGEIQRVVYEMHFRDMTLFVNKEDLLLASDGEVATFLEE